MQAVQYRNTMASAQPKPKVDDGIRRFDTMELRRLNAQRAIEERAREKARQDAIIAQQRAEARALIELGRAAAAKLRINEEIEPEFFRHTYAQIERRICKAFGLSRMELHSRRGHKNLCLARHAVAYWACRLTLHSLPEIGRFLGKRDHTTILHGRNVYPAKRAKMGRHLREVR